MAFKVRETLILAKMEVTNGVDAAPTAAANAILVKNVSGEPFEAEAIDRGLAKPYLGASPKIHVGVHRKLGYEVEIAGSGTAGDVPGFDSLLRMCGLAAVVTAGTKVEYTPVSSGFESGTQYFAIAKQVRKYFGARGTVSLTFAEKALPLFKFDFTGLWTPPVDILPSAPDFSKFKDPLPVNYANTQFSIFGKTVPLKSLELQFNNEVAFTDRPNQQLVDINDRQMGGSIVFEWPDLADWNIEQHAIDGTTGAMALTHGTAAGNIFAVDAPRVQILQPKFSDDSGKRMCQANLLLIPTDAGNDEIKLTVK